MVSLLDFKPDCDISGCPGFQMREIEVCACGKRSVPKTNDLCLRQTQQHICGLFVVSFATVALQQF